MHFARKAVVVRTVDGEERHDCFVLVDGAADLALDRLVATDVPWEGGSVANENGLFFS